MISDTKSLPNIFVSYSSKNEDCMKLIETHLKALSFTGKLVAWSDQSINTGGDWKTAIIDALEHCDAAILLVSSDFLASNFIQNEELPRLYKRHQQDHIPIIPVPIHDVSWQTHDPLGKFQSYEKNPIPLDKLKGPEKHTAIKKLCDKLIDIFESQRPDPQRNHDLDNRLRVLCIFPRPLGATNPEVKQAISKLDLRSEWSLLAGAVRLRKTPVALLRVRPPTKEHLLDRLRALAQQDIYPHIVHIFAPQCSGDLILEDEVGQAQQISLKMLVREISQIGPKLPLLVCRTFTKESKSSVTYKASKHINILNILILRDKLEPRIEFTSWADLYSRLAHCEDIDSAFRQALNIESADFSHYTPGPALEDTLVARDPYIYEGVEVNRLPAGSKHYIGRNKELIDIARQMTANRITLITGITGLGGRSLALEATYRNAWRFSGHIAVFDADHHQGKGDSLTFEAVISRLSEELDIDRILGMPSGANADRLTQIRCLLENGDYLFVFLCMEIFEQHNPGGTNKLLDALASHRSHCIVETKYDLRLKHDCEARGVTHIKMERMSGEETRQLTRLLASDRPTTNYIAEDRNKIKQLASLSRGYPKILDKALGLLNFEPFEEIVAELSNHEGPIAKQIDALVDRAINRLDVDAHQLLGSLQLFPAMSFSSLSLNAIQNTLELSDIAPARDELIAFNLVHLDVNAQRYYWDKIVHDRALRIALDDSLKSSIDQELIRIYSGASGSASSSRLREVLMQGESAVNILAVIERTMDRADVKATSADEKKPTNMISLAYDMARQAQRRGLEFEGRSLLQSVMEFCWESGTKDGLDEKKKAAALLYDIASVEQAQGDYEEAERHYETSLQFNELDESNYGIARSLHGLGRLHHDKGDLRKAEEQYEASLRLRIAGRDSGDPREDNSSIAQIHHELARLLHDRGRYLEAEQMHKKTLSMREQSGFRDERGLAATKYELGRLAQDRGDWEAAKNWYEESKTHWEEGHYWIGVGIVQHALASLLALQCKTSEAIDSFKNCLLVQRQAGDKRGVAATLVQLGLLELGNSDKAGELFRKSAEMQKEAHFVQGQLIAEMGLAILKQRAGDIKEAETILVGVREKSKEIQATKLSARAELLLGTLWLKGFGGSTIDGSCRDRAFVSLITALELALTIRNDCLEAVAKIRLGQLMETTFHVNTTFEKDGLRALEKLHHEKIEDPEHTYDSMTMLC